MYRPIQELMLRDPFRPLKSVGDLVRSSSVAHFCLLDNLLNEKLEGQRQAMLVGGHTEARRIGMSNSEPWRNLLGV